ncbi:hypothetical protein MYP_1976 [Sporocytophaga myxococcoides]|uniref:Uncharacterized protein n=1 Tax=Sporocytophaga myxococcoides TaxID=153721 RepID=A0A098LFG4_9BACT|nr:hypothetical protein MYP_1976 [Sporocytophaga myxococcoides]
MTERYLTIKILKGINQNRTLHNPLSVHSFFIISKKVCKKLNSYYEENYEWHDKSFRLHQN